MLSLTIALSKMPPKREDFIQPLSKQKRSCSPNMSAVAEEAWLRRVYNLLEPDFMSRGEIYAIKPLKGVCPLVLHT